MKLSIVRGIQPRKTVASLGLFALLAATGCQVDVGGQTLPSPYWHGDDVQYFPPGPEFKLSREAAALKAFKAQQGLPSPVTPAPSEVAPIAPMVPVAPLPEEVPAPVAP